MLLSFTLFQSQPNLVPSAYGSTTFGLTSTGSISYPTAKTVSVYGNAQIDTAQSKMGGASMLFDGTGDYLSVADSSVWAFGTGNFTIDGWIKFNGYPANGKWMTVYHQYVDASNWITFSFVLNVATYLWVFRVYSGATVTINIQETATVVNGQVHIAIVRSDSSWYIFENGNQLGGTDTDADAVPDLASPVYIGTGFMSSAVATNGWLDEYRISDTARWVTNFTPETTRYDNDAGTLLLLHGDGADGSQSFPDDVVTGQGLFSNFVLSETASSVTSMSVYSHATGNMRLSIYTDSNGPATRLCETADTAVTANAWTNPSISGCGSLSAATYWLGLQWNPGAAYALGPSYTAGTSNTGYRLYLSYGTFPASGTGGTLTAENYSIYATYAPPTYMLNLKIVVFDEASVLNGAQVTMNNGTDQVKTVSGGWANYTGISSASVTIKVKWQNSWVNGSFTETMGANRTVTVVTKVYSSYALSWRFNDNLTAFTPTSVILTAPNGTDVTVSGSYTLALVQNGSWAVKAVNYWDDNVVPATNPTFSPTADSQSKQTACRIYSTTPAWKTNAGAALYVNPSSFTWTAPNGTILTPLSGGVAYWIQNGTTTVSDVTWQGSNVTPNSLTFDASDGNPNLNVEVHSITPVWKDNDGATLSVQPTTYKILGPNATLTGALTAGVAYQIQNGTALFREVTWEGSDVTPSTGGGFSVESGSPTTSLRIYSLTLQGIDQSNNNLNGNTTFTVTFPNATATSFTANATGYYTWPQVQNGSYSVVMLWNSLTVNSTYSGTLSADADSSVKGLVYYTATNSFRAAVDAGTLSNIVASDQAVSFTASATGSRTVKVYVGAKSLPRTVYVDGVAKTINVDYTYDATTTLVSIPLSFSTHIVMVSWSTSSPSGGTTGGGGGALTTTGVEAIFEQIAEVIAIAKGNPYIVGFVVLAGLFGGAGVAYRQEWKRTAIFLCGMGALFTINSLFFWNWIPQSWLQTDLGFLPLTVNKYLIPIPSLELPTVAPTGQQVTTWIMELVLLGITALIPIYALTKE